MNSAPASVFIIEAHPILHAELQSIIATVSDLCVAEPGLHSPDAVQMVITHQQEILFLTRKPDIILFALGNPGLDDLKVLKALRTFLTDIPILAFTSSEVPGQDQAALDSGAQAALPKSASRADLIQALRGLRSTSLMNSPEEHDERQANDKIAQ